MKCAGWRAGEPTTLSVSPWVGSRAIKSLRNIRAGRKPRITERRVGMDITWVDDRIAVGGGIWNNANNMAALVDAGITHIINMQIEFDDEPLAAAYKVELCSTRVDDDFEKKDPEVFERGVEFALEALKKPENKLFIHCAAGVHRAPMMALAVLAVIRRAKGQTVERAMEEAMNLIEEKRQVADFADVYVRSVEEFLTGRR
jgi:predicted protein tyrosine phosphatase